MWTNKYYPTKRDWYMVKIRNEKSILMWNTRSKFWVSIDGKTYQPEIIDCWLDDNLTDKMEIISKEYFLGEGWVFEKEDYEIIYSINLPRSTPNWELRYIPKYYKIELYSYLTISDTGKRTYERRYQGKCRNIEEFNYICELVGIKGEF